MAPAKSNLRRSQQQNERIYELGVQGRKTGVTLRDTGVRDEHGMQPIEDIFSSPGNDDTGSDDGEADMDLTTASGPIPLVNGHNGNRLPVPRSRSPIKTNLKSPAIRNPHLARRSSPTPGDDNLTSAEPANPRSAKRRLDFSNKSYSLLKPGMGGARMNGVNGYNTPDDDDDEDEAILHGQLNPAAVADDSMQMIGNDDQDDEVEEEEEAEEEENEPENDAGEVDEEDEEDEEEDLPIPSVDKEPTKTGKKRGRPAKNKVNADDSQTSKPPKRRREQVDSPDVEPDAAEPEPKKQRKEAGASKGGRKPAAAATTTTAGASAAASKAPVPAPKKRGRKRKSDPGVGDNSVVVPRGAPLPRTNKGLVITRREVPGESGTLQTRSGRTSYRPLAFWRNEHVDYDQGEVFDDAFAPAGQKKGDTAHFVLPSIKEIHRVDEDSPPPPAKSSSRRKGGGGAGRPRRTRRGDEDEDDNDEPAEPWEEDPGEVYGDVRVWEPDHQFNPPGPDDPVDRYEDKLALSRQAVRPEEVRGGSFGFAKALTLPFFAAGIVDLPPGSEKKTKNSRKMHLTFFVFTGRVLVTINETQFRISRGGMWFVPRGNYYSIQNDYDHPVRLFFAQGCEMSPEMVDVDQSAIGY